MLAKHGANAVVGCTRELTGECSYIINNADDSIHCTLQ